MSVTIPNLRDETISQARAEAQHLLAQAKETTISLNVSGAESGQIGDALNQVIGCFHLGDGLFVEITAQLSQAPVFQDAGMQEILVDGNEQDAQIFIELADNFAIAFHAFSFLYYSWLCR